MHKSFVTVAVLVAMINLAPAATYDVPRNLKTTTEYIVGPGGGGGGFVHLAQFVAGNAQPVAPAPGPAIGVGQVGAPTYVIPAAPKSGLINIGQAFGDAATPYVNAIVEALITALVGWLVLKIQQKTGVQIQDSRRDALTRFLLNEAGSLIADGKVKLQGLKVDVNDEALAASANKALARIPDVLKDFNLSPETIAAKIVDTIPQTAAGAQIVAQAHAEAAPPSPVAPAPMPRPVAQAGGGVGAANTPARTA